jgi:hypothetical protein
MKLFIFLAFYFYIVNNDLSLMRAHFEKISIKEEYVTQLKELSLKKNDIESSIKLAYYASAIMASAKYKFNPASKLSTFNTGKKILENSIKTDSLNIETRYIRFTIQNNVPSILGYKQHLINDKKYLLNNIYKIKNTDTELYIKITTYFLTQTTLSQTDKLYLQ